MGSIIMNLTDALANAIIETNKDKGSYCIRFTSGKVKGRYLSFDYGKSSARKSANLYTTVCSTEEEWLKHIDRPFKGLTFDIITLKQPTKKES